jgi:hypothetical protein
VSKKLNVWKSPEIQSLLWETIEGVIPLQVFVSKEECEVYEYTPEDAPDVSLWCHYFFFYHKQEKRVLFLTVRGVRYPFLMSILQMERSFSYDDVVVQEMDM